MLIFHTPDLDGELIPYSYRARAVIPSEGIEDSKVTNDLTKVKKDDIVVLGKKHSLEDAEYLKEKNIKFIIDVADNKFRAPNFQHWYETIPMASHVTTTCEVLSNVVKHETGTGLDHVTVIPDPTERKRKKPNFKVKPEMTMCWYGAEKNFEKIDWGIVQSEMNKVHPTKFVFMTNISGPKTNKPWKRIKSHHYWMKDTNISDLHCSAFDELVPWSFEGQEKMVDQADIVVIPCTNDNEARSKGNNRPIDALQRGKFVLSNPGIPSYHKLDKFISVGNLCTGYKKALRNPEKVLAMIKEGQAEIDKRYTPKAISEKWQNVYGLLL